MVQKTQDYTEIVETLPLTSAEKQDVADVLNNSFSNLDGAFQQRVQGIVSKLEQALSEKIIDGEQEKVLQHIKAVQRDYAGNGRERVSKADSGKEAVKKRNPIPAEILMTAEGVVGLEQALGINITEFHYQNSQSFEFHWQNITYIDTASALASRLAKEWFGYQNYAARVRWVLMRLKSGEKFDKIIAEITARVKGKVENKAKRNPIPAGVLTTAESIIALEQALGIDITRLNYQNSQSFEFHWQNITYVDTARALAQRLARKWLGNENYLTRVKQVLIQIKAGEKFTEIVAGLKSKIENAPERNPVPAEILITAEGVIALEQALGIDITDFDYKNSQPFEFHWQDVIYTDTVYALTQRLARKWLGSENYLARIKQVFVQLKAGKKFDEIISEFENKSQRKGILAEILTTAEGVIALEQTLGIDIAKFNYRSSQLFEFQWLNITYADTNVALAWRLAKEWFGSENCVSRVKQVFVQLKDGKNFDEIIAEIRSKKENEPKRNPILAAVLTTAEGVIALEKVLGIDMTKFDERDGSLFEFKWQGITYVDSARALAERLAKGWLANRNYSCRIKQVFIHLKSGRPLAEAIRLALQDDDEQILNRIRDLKLEEMIAVFQGDSLKLRYYLQFAFPELGDEEINRLVEVSFRGLTQHSKISKEAIYLEFPVELPAPQITSEVPDETDQNIVLIKGRVSGANYVYVSGVWNHHVHVHPDGTFEACIPLKPGEMNQIRLMALNLYHYAHNSARSEQLVFNIKQTKVIDDVEALFQMLSALKEEILESLQKDPERLQLLSECAEQTLIKKFLSGFESGQTFIERQIELNQNSLIQNVLKQVLGNFQAVDQAEYPNVRPEHPLHFFQKYCVYKIQQSMRNKQPGIILGLDPGLGKTATSHVAINGQPAVIITPNSVVSAWGEEAHKFVHNPDIQLIQNMPTKERKKLLKTTTARHIVTNIEFLQKPEDQERFELLSRDGTGVIVFDEAHSRANLHTKQTIGARQIKGDYLLMVTATPAKHSLAVRRMLHNLLPDDPRFASDSGFLRAFPKRDPQACKVLNRILSQYMIRFRKRDVMEEYDLLKPISEQTNRLPHKSHIPPEQLGEFEMHEEQAQAIYEMFLDWRSWCLKYGHFISNDEISQMDHVWQGHELSKQHALRQIVNSPAYIGHPDLPNRKHEKMQEIVKYCLDDGRKPLIFSKYISQSEAYAQLLANHNPGLYTGMVSKEGTKKRADGTEILYKVNEHGTWEFDQNGYPIEDTSGKPMLALDYERLVFQHVRERKILNVNYAAGATGSTFTAGHAMIADDLARDCVEEIQAEDRNHRIDETRTEHYDNWYFKLISKYPQSFLERMKQVWLEKQEDGTWQEVFDEQYAREKRLKTAYKEFFEQGTYDQVHNRNLEVQRRMFHLINDGISDESILHEDQEEFRGFA